MDILLYLSYVLCFLSVFFLVAYIVHTALEYKKLEKTRIHCNTFTTPCDWRWNSVDEYATRWGYKCGTCGSVYECQTAIDVYQMNRIFKKAS